MPTGTGFSASGRRTALGYWIPLAVTVGVATLGIAAWIWSERSEDDDDGDYPGDDQGRRDGFPPPGPGEEYAPVGPQGGYPLAPGVDTRGEDEGSMMARMQGALRRTPSPQQIFDGASKRVAAGVAAAGALMGGNLTSIREEDRGDFEDHSRWSEEVRSRTNERSQPAATTMSGAVPTRGPVAGQQPFGLKKKTVAIVVSSVSQDDAEEFSPEHAVSCQTKAYVVILNVLLMVCSRSFHTSPNMLTPILPESLF